MTNPMDRLHELLPEFEWFHPANREALQLLAEIVKVQAEEIQRLEARIDYLADKADAFGRTAGGA